MAAYNLPNGLVAHWRPDSARSGLIREARAHLLDLTADEILQVTQDVLCEKGQPIGLAKIHSARAAFK